MCALAVCCSNSRVIKIGLDDPTNRTAALNVVLGNDNDDDMVAIARAWSLRGVEAPAGLNIQSIVALHRIGHIYTVIHNYLFFY